MTIDQALDYALERWSDGAHAEAMGICEQVLAQSPWNVDALNLLGEMCRVRGDLAAAMQFLGRALHAAPMDARLHLSIGLVNADAGRWEDAAEACRRAIALNPDLPEAHNNLGNALRQLRRPEEAIEAFRTALRLSPESGDVLNNLAIAYQSAGRWDDALGAFEQALAAQPESASAHFNLGLTLARMGRKDEAAKAMARALELNPALPHVSRLLASLCWELGRRTEAIDLLRRRIQQAPQDVDARQVLAVYLLDERQAIEAEDHLRLAIGLKPDSAGLYNDWGRALVRLDRGQEAIGAYQRALALDPDFAFAYNNLGTLLESMSDTEGALACYRKAYELEPNMVELRNNLGTVLKERGEVDEAIAHLCAALELSPGNADVHSNLVYVRHFHLGSDARMLGAEAAEWHHRHAEKWRPAERCKPSRPDPERRLRVGYVSPDFWEQAECYFVLPLLENHDASAVEIFCYSNNPRTDDITRRYRACADQWRDVWNLGDEAMAEQIASDEIDILVDLTMHMRDHRLLTFARQPAPIQVTWLAYPGTTGLPEIDYRFTDWSMEPEDLLTCVSAEMPVRLPDSWCCYEAVGSSPAVSPAPAEKNGYLTFGSLNNGRKHNTAVLSQWARLMEAIPDSRLVLLAADEATRDRLREFFRSSAVDPQRIDFIPPSRRYEYLSAYGQIDVGLDPFPYNGITTTCDALWMGVPVMTIPGTVAAARAGASLLRSAGLEQFIAADEASWIALGQSWSERIDELAALRRELRRQVSQSPLMNGARFARNVERAYREMWRKCCAR